MNNGFTKIRKRAWKQGKVFPGGKVEVSFTFTPPGQSFIVAMAAMSNMTVVLEEHVVFLKQGAEYSEKCSLVWKGKKGPPRARGVKFQGEDHNLEDAIKLGLVRVERTGKKPVIVGATIPK